MFQWRYVLVTLAFIGLALLGIPLYMGSSPTLEEEKMFQEFMVQYNRSYSVGSDHYYDRLNNFKVSLKTIQELNEKRTHEHSAKFGVTQFADMTPEEFEEEVLSVLELDRNRTRTHHHHHRHRHSRAVPSDVPQSIDWKIKGMTTPVKDQKQCGACWAFSVIETMESMAAIRNRIMQELSVQQGVDCAKNGNAGCDGGDTCAFAQWLSSGKIVVPPATSYPYVGHEAVCRKIQADSGGVQIASNHTCQSFLDKEDKLAELLSTHGPVAAAVNALPWQFYLSGIIHGECANSLTSLNHAVQITGYDLSAPVPHYHVRNSWGVLWGERGYARVHFGQNKCGIALHVTSLDVL